MTAPDPHQIVASLNATANQLRGLADQYRWLHPAAYERAVHDTEHHHTTNTPDLSTQLVTTERVRNHINLAGKLILRAEGEIHGAWSELGHALNLIEAAIPTDPTPASERQLPRTITKAELKAAKEAKRRRIERGDNWGAA